LNIICQVKKLNRTKNVQQARKVGKTDKNALNKVGKAAKISYFKVG